MANRSSNFSALVSLFVRSVVSFILPNEYAEVPLRPLMVSKKTGVVRIVS